MGNRDNLEIFSSDEFKDLERVIDATKTHGARIYHLIASGDSEKMDNFMASIQGTQLHDRFGSLLENLFNIAKADLEVSKRFQDLSDERAKLTGELKYAKEVGSQRANNERNSFLGR